MKLYFFLLTVLFFACKKPKKGTDSIIDSSRLTNDTMQYLEMGNSDHMDETFIDSLTIGMKTKNKVEIREISENESTYVSVQFFTKSNNQWIIKDELKVLKNGAIGADPKISDFNNDGFNDLTFITGIAARGANEIRQLYIYEKSTDKLKFIKNAEDYPSFLYNSELDCIDAFLVYGGCMTVFLKIEADSLKEFATVELNDGLTVKTFDRNGNGTVILEDTSNKAGYVRYKNFKPLKEYEDY